MANEVKIILSADGSGVKVVTDGVAQQFTKMGDAAKEASDKATSGFGATRQGIMSISEQLKNAQDAVAGYAKAFASLWTLDKLYEYGKEMALMAARYETLGVSMSVVGKNAGYTSEQMDSAAAAMQRSGISMIESRQQAMRLVQAHIDLADSQKLARIAQDAAVIGNMNSSEAFAAMIHGISTGQPEVLRTIGLNVSMEQSYKVMAATLGKHVDQLTQNEKTQGILNAVMLAGQDIAGTYEAAMDTAGKQLNSMKRYTEDLKTVQGEVFNEVLTAGVMAFTAHLKDANEEAKALSANKELKSWGEGITDVLAAVADNANNAYQALKILGLTGAMVKAMGDTTPLDFAGRSAIMDGYNADVAAALATEDRFSKALAERRSAVAAKSANDHANTLAKDAAYTTAMNAYAKSRQDGMMSEAQYAKTVQTTYQSMYGDNHVYRDTQATTPKKGVDEVAKALAFYNDLMDQSSGYTKTYAEDQNKLALALKTGKISYQQYAEAAQKLLDQQPLMKDAAKAQETATKAYDDALKGIQSSAANEAESLTKAIDAQRLHNAEIGKTPEQVELAKRAEQDRITDMLQGNADILESAITLAAAQDGFDKATLTLWDEKLKSLREQVALRHQLAGELATGAALEGADQLAKANKKAAEESSKYWEDALMRAFESGKGFFQSLWDTIKHTMETQVLKVMVSATGLTGMTAAGASESGGVGGALSLATGIDKLTTSMGNMASAFNGSGLAGFAKSGIGQSMGLSTAATAGNNASAYVGPQLTDTGSILAGMPIGGILSAYSIGGVKGFATGVATTALAGGVAASIAGTGFAAGATGALAAIGPWGWAAMGAAALFGMGSDGPSVQGTGEGSRTYDATGNVKATTSKDAWGGMSASTDQGITSLAASYMLTAAKLGIKTVETQFSVGSNIMSDGSDPKFAISGGAVGHGIAGAETAYSADAYNLQASRVVFAALQGSELPKYLAGVFDGITASSATQDQITSALTAAEALGTFHAQLMAMPTAFQKLADTSYATMQNIAALSGGMDKLQANLSTYYTNFYTAEEQRAQTVANINAATAGSGLDAATATRDSFRQLVEAQDLTTDSGRKMYAALIGVSGAFAGITTAATAVANTLAATQTAVQNATALAQRVQDAAYAAQTAALNTQISSVSSSVQKLTSFADSLKSTLDGMRVIGSDSSYRSAAQAQISTALAIAKAGGPLPLDGQLTSALSTVSKPSEALFGTFQDYARDFYRTANDISALNDLTGNQLTAKDKVLSTLQDQLSTLDKIYATLQGTGGTPSVSSPSAGKVVIGGTEFATSPASSASAAGTYATRTELGSYGTITQAVTDPDKIARLNSINAYVNSTFTGSVQSLQAIAEAAKSYGVSQFELATATGYLPSDIKSLFDNAGIPAFAVGTNYVPRDMIAQIHQGEAIIPKAYNPAAAGGQNTARLEALIEALTAEVAALKEPANRTADSTKKLAGQFDTATEGGRAMQTEAFA